MWQAAVWGFLVLLLGVALLLGWDKAFALLLLAVVAGAIALAFYLGMLEEQAAL